MVYSTVSTADAVLSVACWILLTCTKVWTEKCLGEVTSGTIQYTKL